MLISKFNKLIHNKIVWGAFAILVSLAMVGLFTPSGAGSRRDVDARDVGTLYDETVSADELARARLFALGFRPRPVDSDEDRVALDEMAWRRLTLIRTAARMGITVTDDELARAIQSNRSFQEDGRFSLPRYEALIHAQMKVPVSTFEAYFREEMILQKLTKHMDATLWVPPSDVTRNIAHFTDLIELKAVEVTREKAIAGVTVSNDDVRAFYDENTELFREPEAVAVRYVEWPVSNFLGHAEVAETDVQNYYDEHLADYVIRPEGTNATNVTETTYRELADVSDEIRDAVRRDKAFFLAESKAVEFADELAPGRYGQAVAFESVAVKFDRNVMTSAFFTAYGDVAGLNVGPDFSRAAFALDAGDAAGYYSYPVKGEDAVFVLAASTNRPAFIPDFSNVVDRATDLATREAERNAYAALVDTTREKLMTALESGSSLDQAAEAQGLAITKLPAFSVYDDDSAHSISNFNSIVPAVLDLAKGEMSEAIQLPDRTLIACVANRTPGSLATAEMVRPEVLQMLQGYRIRPHFDQWSKDLMAKVRVVKKIQPVTDIDDSDL